MKVSDLSITGPWVKGRCAGNSCVEMASTVAGDVAVRDSKDPDGLALVFTKAEIQALLVGARNGEFDHLI